MKRKAMTKAPVLLATGFFLLSCALAAPIAPFGPTPPRIVDVFPDAQGQIIPPPPTIKRIKFLCGDLTPALVGNHSTAINVLNPHSDLSPPLPPGVGMTKEIIVDQPEPPTGATAASIRTNQIPFRLASLASIEIDCPDIAARLKETPPGLPVAQASNSKGYVIIQVPCVEVGVIDPNGKRFACFDVVVDTVYEQVLSSPLVNKVLFTLNKAVSAQLPGSTPLEVVIQAPAIATPLDIEAKLRELLSIPANIKIKILAVSVAPVPSGVSMDVEPSLRQP